MLVLGVPAERIRVFGSAWSDGGLWNDIAWLADRAWAAPDDDERRCAGTISSWPSATSSARTADG